ncbi:hypothetical protein, partial [Achromobacter xylosoxidans]
ARDLRAVLHRMRGGFAAVQAMDLYQQAESAEDRLVADGLNDAVRALLTALAVSLRQTLAEL